jgi:hypothetical protein
MSKGPTDDLTAHERSCLLAPYMGITSLTQLFKFRLQIWIGHSSKTQMLHFFDRTMKVSNREVLGRTNRLLSFEKDHILL